MASLVLYLLMILAVIGYLARDIRAAWYYRNMTESDLARWPFFCWWVSVSAGKILFLGATILVIGFGLFMDGYTMDLPFLVTWDKLPKAVRWGGIAGLGLSVIVIIDLFISWWSYRSQQEWSDEQVGFFRWLVRRKTVEFCALCGIACLALGVTWATFHYHLLEIKGESYGYLASARDYYKLKKYREAMLELKNAIRQNPNDSDARFLLGLSCQQLGALPEARLAYREALRLDPKLAAAHLHLGRVALAMRVPAEAIREAEQALALEPEAPEPRLLLATTYLVTGRWEQAAEQYRAVLRNDPANLAVRKGLIELLVKRRAYADARLVAEAGLKESPGDTELKVGLAAALNGEGRTAEADGILKEAGARDTSSPLPLMAQGDIYVLRRQFVPALESYEKALKRSPHLSLVMSNIALLHADHGYDLNRAALLASRLCNTYPGDPLALDTMGWVLYRQGKVRQALPLLRTAAVKAPMNPDFRTHYGKALLKSGREAAGRRELKAAQQIAAASR